MAEASPLFPPPFASMVPPVRCGRLLSKSGAHMAGGTRHSRWRRGATSAALLLAERRGLHRRIAEALALGHTTADVAKRFRVTPGRVSQLRRELQNSWQTFHGETIENVQRSERLK